MTMPYESREDLPESVKHVLPEHAQDIYKAAFNHAWEEYKHSEDRQEAATREETAHHVAWSAVKQKYHQGDDGCWHPKENKYIRPYTY
jgi:cation transport regulator